MNCLEALAAEKPIKSGMRNLAIDCGQELATYAGIGIVTVHQLENGITQPRHATWDVVSGAFEATGVPFIDANERGGPAVRLKEPQGIKRSE